MRHSSASAKKHTEPSSPRSVYLPAGLMLLCLGTFATVVYSDASPSLHYQAETVMSEGASSTPVTAPVLQTLNIAAYNEKLLELAGNPMGSTTATTTKAGAAVAHPLWPVKTVYPQGGAVLPFNRIVAYYGNFYSTQMGVLGEYPPDIVIEKLQAAAASWAAADPTTPVIPAIDYIAVTAQGSPGADGTYRLRMPASQIEKALSMANSIHGLLFLDVQVGQSTLEQELPVLEPYLKLPNVELAIDPEFSMKTNAVPGTIIGTFSAADINYAAQFLATIVDENHLTPKILVVHRFTEDMVTGYRNIQPLPEVEIVMDMDGWGYPEKKIHTYQSVIASEPVQFTGFKLFYRADLRPPSTRMLTPQEILKLIPQPSFIQYQ